MFSISDLGCGVVRWLLEV